MHRRFFETQVARLKKKVGGGRNAKTKDKGNDSPDIKCVL